MRLSACVAAGDFASGQAFQFWQMIDGCRVRLRNIPPARVSIGALSSAPPHASARSSILSPLNVGFDRILTIADIARRRKRQISAHWQISPQRLHSDEDLRLGQEKATTW